MPFPPTPSQTASNTPTPSITPSVTPSFTPTGTECPSEFLITYGSYSSNSCGNFSLLPYSSFIRYNSINYSLSAVSIGFGNIQLGECIPIRYPYVGLIYRFDFLIDPNLALCDALRGYKFDRVDYQVISFDGIIGGIPTYSITERYYLNNVLVDTITSSVMTIIDGVVETCNVNTFGIIPEFRVEIPVTPTPSVTNTMTPTMTPTMNVSPTQTNTPSFTPTTTPSGTGPCTCFSSATINVQVAGNITFNDCNGNPTIENFNPGDGQTYGDGTFCIRKDTNGGTAEYTIVSFNDCCNP